MIASLPPLILVDGSGYIFRAYHALPGFSRPDGTPVGAVFGFTSMLLKLLETEGADGLAVIFDAGRVTFRQTIYPEYKAHRPPAPEDLIPQFPLIRDVCGAFGIPSIEVQGFEADDLIATYAKESVSQGRPVKIISGDKDLMQLVGSEVSLLDPIKNKIIGIAEVVEKFGVGPDRVVDVQALMGDSSDNVPGVPGIGPKGAAALIQEYGDLETLLENAISIKKPGHRKAIEENAEKARISKDLVTLRDDVPLPMPIDKLHERHPDSGRLISFLKEQGFHSLIPRATRYLANFDTHQVSIITQDEGATSSVTNHSDYTLIQDIETLHAYMQEAHRSPVLAVDTETNSLNALHADLVGVSLCFERGKACYIPLQHKPPQTLFENKDTIPFKQISPKEGIEALKPILEDPNIMKVGHNIKFDMLVLQKYGVNITPYEDTILMSYVLDGTKTLHNLDTLAKKYFGHTTKTYKEVTGTGKDQVTFDYVDLKTACHYAAEDADYTFRLFEILKTRLFEEKQLSIYQSLDKPLVSILAQMEATGIMLHTRTLMDLSQKFQERIEVLEKEIHTRAGRQFNIASPKQLSEILFGDLGLEGKKKGKSGDLSTSADILESLAAQGHVLPTLVLEWRGLSKLKNTYTDALLKERDSQTGRVHTSYSQTTTTTGRLSSSNPNLQNIPIRTEDGRLIRRAFIAPQNKQLLALDYSQIELRLLAHVADVPTLRNAFEENQDIHAITAAHIFGVPLENIDKDLRRKAKAINFGIIYGISPFGLSQQLGISQSVAKEHIAAYFKTYPGIEAYMESTKEEARSKGYVETPFGRRCYIQDINDRNPQRRAFAERQAINAPLQGGSADLMKKAMILVNQHLRKTSSKTQLLLQVHDELVFEMPNEEISWIPTDLKKIFETAMVLRVPLLSEVRSGLNWGEMSVIREV